MTQEGYKHVTWKYKQFKILVNFISNRTNILFRDVTGISG
ncbi:hypothetical protein [Planctobacterium marinum]|nr:hypothetical protein [Planctobacterium marinum]